MNSYRPGRDKFIDQNQTEQWQAVLTMLISFFDQPVDQSGHPVYTVPPVPESDRRPGIGMKTSIPEYLERP
jgi:hypothetical protein